VGLGLDLVHERREFAAHIVDRDDLVLGNRDDAVGKAHVQPIIGRGRIVGDKPGGWKRKSKG
jgi:hypothetical protein